MTRGNCQFQRLIRENCIPLAGFGLTGCTRIRSILISVYMVEGKDYEINEDGSIKLVSDSFIDSRFVEAIPIMLRLIHTAGKLSRNMSTLMMTPIFPN